MILIDADILVYRVGWSCNEKSESNAITKMDDLIEDILGQLSADKETSHYVLYLTGRGNFRTEYATTAIYKGNRKDKEKPVHIQLLRQHLIDNWAAVVTEGEEADDAIAIAGTKHGDKTIMVSLDKDFDQIPGWHYNFVKKKRYYVTPEEGMLFFYRQILMGDRIDNIIGIYGIGEKKSAKLLEDCVTEQDYYSKCVEMYDGDEDRVIENGRMLWLRRYDGEIWSFKGEE